MTHKYSRQRESIRQNLLHRADHPTADMIFEDIRKIYPKVSLGTVYRNLSLLSDLGEISRMSSLGGADRYDGITEPHNHFVCRTCGNVLDIKDQVTETLSEEAGKHFEGRIEGCSVTFYGTCPDCMKRS